MTTFISTGLPYLRILQPDGSYSQLQAGRLEVAESDWRHAAVMAEAIRNPAISIMVNSTTCEYDGVVFKGDHAADELAAHKKAIHFELWQKEQDLEHARVQLVEVKARAGYACDICAPVQTFGDEAGLAEHATLIHATAPTLDEQGNTVGGAGDDDGGRRPGEVAPAAAPAAHASTRHAAPELSINALRAQAKSLGLNAAGNKVALAERIAAAQ